MRKRAFSLVELVISIVIIGIVSISFPLILSQTTNNTAFAIQQEAIMATKTYINTILSYPWDRESIEHIPSTGSKAAAMNVNNGDDELEAAVGDFRKGQIDGAGRRKMIRGVTLSPLNKKDTDQEDINHFNGLTYTMDVTPSNLDSILKLTLTPKITYINDDANYADDKVSINFEDNTTTEKNIKSIEVETKGSDITITLRAFSSNIGETLLDSRNF